MARVTMMIGIPGSGKSTYAKKNLPGVYVSPDAIRKELYGDTSIQGNPAEVFGLVETRIRKAIRNGSDVVYDATNTTKFRSATVAEFREYGATEVNGVFMNTPYDVCMERNLNRDDRNEPVPVEVMERMYNALMENPPKVDEFDHFEEVIFNDARGV